MSDKPKLLFVDDDDEIRTQMRWMLAHEYDVVFGSDRASAVDAFKQHQPSVTLLDLGLPPSPGTPAEGLATLSDVLLVNPVAKVIVITGQADKHIAVQAIGEGAYDFLPKPVDADILKAILNRAFYLADIEAANRDMQKLLRWDTFEGMLGTSPKMQQVFAAIRKVANINTSVLVLGETGTKRGAEHTTAFPGLKA